MPNVFKYTNFREYLSDYYHDKKKQSHSFSYKNFSNKAGFASKSFLYNVIKNKKNLSRSSIIKITESLKLNKTESEYFETLVAFNQSKNFKEREFYFDKLNSIRPQNTEASTAKRIRRDQYEFFSKWYNVVIRSIIDLYPFKDDYQWLAQMVTPKITAVQARRSINLLERLGIIQKQKNGYYKTTVKILSTGLEVESLAVQNFHLETMTLAGNALKSFPKNMRNVSGLTLGISKDAYKNIIDEIYLCQKKILKIAENDKNSDGVYQLNFHFFPVSKNGK